jgi:hypothetical protein
MDIPTFSLRPRIFFTKRSELPAMEIRCLSTPFAKFAHRSNLGGDIRAGGWV